MSADLSPEQIEARRLVEAIIKDADWFIPRLVTMLANDDLVPGDDADVDSLTMFLQRLQPFVTNVLNLRMLSLEPRS